jgi:RNA polymerase sigma factor (TIGR02999 family)
VEKASKPDITQLRLAWNNGDESAMHHLAPVVYRELHRIASRYIARERPGHVLQATALVNEAYIRLVDWKAARWENRAHFFGLAAQMMRRILVDFARTQNYAKRGGGMLQVSLSDITEPATHRPADLIALDDALKALEKLDPRQSRVVELRFFAGLSLEETAQVMGISVGTVRNDWSLAQAWLYRELKRAPKT